MTITTTSINSSLDNASVQSQIEDFPVGYYYLHPDVSLNYRFMREYYGFEDNDRVEVPYEGGVLVGARSAPAGPAKGAIVISGAVGRRR